MIPLFIAKLPVFLFAATNPCPKPNFLGFLPSWYEYLPLKPDALGQCSPVFSNPTTGKFELDSMLFIGLAILDMLLRLAGFVAVISIIISGFQHQFTMGSPDKAAAARHRLYNSLIGLAIALVATAAVTFIGNQLATK
jgi:hypothetical protein